MSREHTEELVGILVSVSNEQEGELDFVAVVVLHEGSEESNHRKVLVVARVFRLDVQGAWHCLAPDEVLY